MHYNIIAVVYIEAIVESNITNNKSISFDWIITEHFLLCFNMTFDQAYKDLVISNT